MYVYFYAQCGTFNIFKEFLFFYLCRTFFLLKINGHKYTLIILFIQFLGVKKLMKNENS